jgi:O-methyltransferase
MDRVRREGGTSWPRKHPITPPAGRIVDVGGGRGALLAGLLRSAPGARGVVFDRAGHRGGGLLVVGYLLPTPPQPSLAYLMDLLMMMVMGGRERTLTELRSLMASEGYEFVRDVSLGESPAWRPWHVVESRRQ